MTWTYETRAQRDEERPRTARRAVTQAAQVLALQRSAGNRAVAALLRRETPWDDDPDRCRPWPIGGPGTQLTIEQEWERLGPIHHLFEVGTLANYRTLRDAFLRHFGVEEDGGRAAVDRAVAYYRTVGSYTFNGTAIAVHEELAARLDRAKALLGDLPYKLEVGGGNIRFVRGSSTVISDHSWGSAIDINGSTSPMMGGMAPGSRRVDVIEAISGEDVTRSADGDRLLDRKRSSDELREEAERLQQASIDLVTAFQDEVTLAATAHRIASERGEPEGGKGELLRLMHAAAKEDRRDIKLWERTRRKKDPEEQRLWDWEPVPEEEEGRVPDDARQALARFVFPTDLGDSTRLWDEELVESTVDVRAAMARWYEDMFTGEGRYKSPTSVKPDDGQLAAHGFMSVPPEVVAALGGTDGADLGWLGTQKGPGKDYMHFELRDEPAKY